jgi:peptidoglycan/LPS O-acetylase OafA/YrhL
MSAPGASRPAGLQARIPSLDGWRAVALALVIGSHTIYATGFPPALVSPVLWVFDGNLGVRIFFVLSGYLISLLLLKEAARTGGISLRLFYARRALRILPVYFLYLGALGVLAALGLYSDALGSWVGSLTFTRNMVGHGDSGTGHFWSLAIEEQFYLVWPVCVSGLLLWRRRGLYLGLLLVPIIACPVVRLFFVSNDYGRSLAGRILGPHSILLYADSLATGCIGAWMAWKSPSSWEWRGRHTALVLGSVAVMIGAHLLQMGDEGLLIDAFGPSLEAWAILACLHLGTHPGSPGFRLLNSRSMVAVGVLSYSIYVWHFIFMSHFMGARLGGSWPYDWRLWLIPAVATSVASYRLVEEPLNRLRLRLRR